MLWILFLAGQGALLLAGLYFLLYSVHCLPCITRCFGTRKIAGWAVSTAITLLPYLLLWLWMGFVNALVVYLHLTVFWLLLDGMRRLFHRLCARRKEDRKTFARRGYAWTAALALLVTGVYLYTGYRTAYRVQKTVYTVQTEKAVGAVRLALFADAHIGTTFDGEGLAAYMAEIQAQQPDVVVIAGDFVDESTTKEDMLAACRSLRVLDAPYGVYYVFGNHDKGQYAGDNRHFTEEELTEALEANGVVVLEDESVVIDGRFALVGRQDASARDRASVQALTQPLAPSLYTIVLDHQPNDYAAEEAAGADLVLSGHTHGGQMIPLKQCMEWLSVGDAVYGMEQRGDTCFLVTSGISDWALRFKTGCISEYVILEIQGT